MIPLQVGSRSWVSRFGAPVGVVRMRAEHGPWIVVEFNFGDPRSAARNVASRLGAECLVPAVGRPACCKLLPSAPPRPKPPGFGPLPDEQIQRLKARMASRVAEARKALGLSQRGLARAMGKSGSWVREVETGGQWPPVYLLVALAKHCRVPVAWFFREEVW